jgi:hypothetical protein
MAAISVVLLLECATLRDESMSLAWRGLEAMFLFALAVMGSPLYPLLRFKPDERTLEITSAGISTAIGKKSGKVAWGQVADIGFPGAADLHCGEEFHGWGTSPAQSDPS